MLVNCNSKNKYADAEDMDHWRYFCHLKNVLKLVIVVLTN